MCVYSSLCGALGLREVMWSLCVAFLSSFVIKITVHFLSLSHPLSSPPPFNSSLVFRSPHPERQVDVCGRWRGRRVNNLSSDPTRASHSGHCRGSWTKWKITGDSKLCKETESTSVWIGDAFCGGVWRVKLVLCSCRTRFFRFQIYRCISHSIFHFGNLKYREVEVVWGWERKRLGKLKELEAYVSERLSMEYLRRDRDDEGWRGGRLRWKVKKNIRRHTVKDQVHERWKWKVREVKGLCQGSRKWVVTALMPKNFKCMTWKVEM